MGVQAACEQSLNTLQDEEAESISADQLCTPGAAAWWTSEHPADQPFDWLMTTIQQAMQPPMTPEIPPLQRAHAIALLGSLFLRSARATELQRANKAVRSRVSALEKRLAALEGPGPAALPQSRYAKLKRSPADVTPAEAQGTQQAVPVPRSPALDARNGSPPVDQIPVAARNDHPPGGGTACPAGTPAIVFAMPRGSP